MKLSSPIRLFAIAGALACVSSLWACGSGDDNPSNPGSGDDAAPSSDGSVPEEGDAPSDVATPTKDAAAEPDAVVAEASLDALATDAPPGVTPDAEPSNASPDGTLTDAEPSGESPDATVTDAEPSGESPDATVTDAEPSDGPSQDEADVQGLPGPYDAATAEGGTSVADAGDGGVPNPVLVQAGPNLKIRGLTADGNVVYVNRVTETYFFQSIAPGSTPTQLFALSSNQSGAVAVLGNLVFVAASQHFYAVDLTLWSSSLGPPVLVTSTNFNGEVWASADSKHFIYPNVTGLSSTIIGSLIGVDVTASGLTTRTLVTGVDLYNCAVNVQFAGDEAVAEYCLPTDAGALADTLQAFQFTTGWTPGLSVAQTASSFVLDPNGEQVAVAASVTNGELAAFPTDGGAPTLLDPTTTISQQTTLVGSASDPWSVDYTTPSGGLMQTYAASPAPQVLVSTGVSAVDATSNDGQWLLTTDQFDQSGNFLDFSLASPLDPGPLGLVADSSQFAGAPLGLGPSRGVFSTDSKSVFFFANYGESSAGISVGDLYAASVANPSVPRLLSTGSAFDDVPLQGSTVLVLDNVALPDSSTIPTVDLEWMDLSTTNPPTVLASGIPREVAVSNDLTQVVYVVLEGSAPGVYLATVP
jgi:hypothetical protein